MLTHSLDTPPHLTYPEAVFQNDISPGALQMLNPYPLTSPEDIELVLGEKSQHRMKYKNFLRKYWKSADPHQIVQCLDDAYLEIQEELKNGKRDFIKQSFIYQRLVYIMKGITGSSPDFTLLPDDYSRETRNEMEETAVLRIYVEELLLRISNKCREIIHFHIFEGKIFQEIAELMDYNEPSGPYGIYKRNLKKLRVLCDHLF